MAALCSGVQYGLSSQQNFSANKDLIFVKLTDSALRAIEDFIRNQNKFKADTPRIRFLGNENGTLSFPSQHHDSGRTSFNFSMSTTADMGGPAGSFECIQGTPPRGPLECLGSIRYKIRVHANDDVYEATRNRMTEVEDKYKNKCTREIKPNQTDIGRKVKVKQTSSSRPPLQPSSQQPRTAQPSMRESLMKSSSYPNPSVAKPPQNNLQPSAHSSLSNGLSNGVSSNHVSSSQRSTVQQNRKPSVPDIAKRPLRERMIHLLALRPFKKLEIHDRLSKEGIRGTNGMSTILKQIAMLKDNCYVLHRHIWNEVKEDWPFFTEAEKQMVKRRKPQNLTPPGGSDGGSSGSGQSPTSTHPGSPPLITSTNGLNGGGRGTKRPGYSEDGFQYKRQRIAHGAKTQPSSQSFGDGQFGYRQSANPDLIYRQSDNVYNRSPIEQNNTQRRPVTDLRDSSNMNPRSRESPPDGSPRSPANNGLMTDEARRNTHSPILQSQVTPNNSQREKDRRINNSNHKVTSSSHKEAQVSPDSQSEPVPLAPIPSRSPVPNQDALIMEIFPDFKKQYVEITNLEQKRAYKADFRMDYAEYTNLYPAVQKVSLRFQQLNNRMMGESENSPRFKDLKKQIVREYQELKKDHDLFHAKNRFQYLHEKLSHIKKLVSDFENSQAQGLVQC